MCTLGPGQVSIPVGLVPPLERYLTVKSVVESLPNMAIPTHRVISLTDFTERVLRIQHMWNKKDLDDAHRNESYSGEKTGNKSRNKLGTEYPRTG